MGTAFESVKKEGGGQARNTQRNTANPSNHTVYRSQQHNTQHNTTQPTNNNDKHIGHALSRVIQLVEDNEASYG
jgi:hypothetical protein